jgi:hypothetical protein
VSLIERRYDPLEVYTITLPKADFLVPQPGLYDLVLSINGGEVRRRQLGFYRKSGEPGEVRSGPIEMFPPRGRMRR